MIFYLINLSIAWIILFILYRSILQREKHFRLNRVYLLSSLILGLLLPFFSFISVNEMSALPTLANEANQAYHEHISTVVAYSNSLPESSQITSTNWNISFVLLIQIIYFLGLFFAVFRISRSILKLSRLYFGSEKLNFGTHKEIIVPQAMLPFSFLNYIFFGNEPYSTEEKASILEHELFHIKAHHSLDILFIEFLKIIFWWHPMVYLYKQVIIQNHEFSADHYVLSKMSRKKYCSLLMKQTFPDINLNLTNPFFQNYVNKRITMMYQSNSKKYSMLKYMTGFIVVALVSLVFMRPATAQHMVKTNSLSFSIEDKGLIEKTTTNKNAPFIVNNNEDVGVDPYDDPTPKLPVPPSSVDDSAKCPKNEFGMHYNLDKMGRLTSCPEGVNGREHYMPIISKFLRENFQWPKEAIESGYQDVLYFLVAIDEEGNLGEILKARDKPYPYGLEKEGRRLIDLIRNNFEFLPGECNSQAVVSGFTFLLSLRVPDDKKHLVKVTNSSNVTPLQKPSIHNVSDKGKMTLYYTSNMNVATSFELLDPQGKVIFTDAIETIYGLYNRQVDVEDRQNGVYTFRATQDGLVKESKMEVAIFQ